MKRRRGVDDTADGADEDGSQRQEHLPKHPHTKTTGTKTTTTTIMVTPQGETEEGTHGDPTEDEDGRRSSRGGEGTPSEDERVEESIKSEDEDDDEYDEFQKMADSRRTRRLLFVNPPTTPRRGRVLSFAEFPDIAIKREETTPQGIAAIASSTDESDGDELIDSV